MVFISNDGDCPVRHTRPPRATYGSTRCTTTRSGVVCALAQMRSTTDSPRGPAPTTHISRVPTPLTASPVVDTEPGVYRYADRASARTEHTVHSGQSARMLPSPQTGGAEAVRCRRVRAGARGACPI